MFVKENPDRKKKKNVTIRKILLDLFICYYCYHIVYCKAIPNFIKYFLMYQVLLITSAITPVSAIA